ncbi:MAG: hypothetical protein ACM30I_02730 [Gemmatimonas sp.]
MASSSIMIVVPAPERAAYGAPRAAETRTRHDDLKTAAANAVRPSSDRPGETAASSRKATGHPFETGDGSPRIVLAEPKSTLPFLAQVLAQQGSADSHGADVDSPDAPPSVRITALRAYGAARESTVEFLSPTPFYDVRI